MGSKKLKAVFVRGHSRPQVADKENVKAVATWMRDNYKTPLGTMTEMGTARGVPVVNGAGGFPTRNFQEGSFEGHERLSGRYMTDTILVDRKSCFACPVRCKRVVEVKDKGSEVSRKYGGPEYESVAGFGSNCGIDDIKAVAKANEICDRFTIDTITSAAMISGAMECAEKGLLPDHLTEGIDLRFGSVDGMLTLLNLIARQEGLGAILAKGPKGAIKELGEACADCFVHVKGQPLPFQEPRWKTGMGIGYALSPTGAEHMSNIHDVVYADVDAPGFAEARAMGIHKATDTLVLNRDKARLWAYMGVNKSIHNVVCLCSFMPYGFNKIVEIIQAVTGWNMTNWELMKVSERCLNMARLFNAREGFTSSDDDLPERCYEPLKSGTLTGQAIDPDNFRSTVKSTYAMLGWDIQTGAPTPGKLLELGLDWLVEDHA
jgi:aldehyde:ferredoxin oxidoreductase